MQYNRVNVICLVGCIAASPMQHVVETVGLHSRRRYMYIVLNDIVIEVKNMITCRLTYCVLIVIVKHRKI